MAQSKANSVTGMEAVQMVSKTLFGQETEEREYIPIRPFATVPAKVAVKLGRTINLGNYESARIDVSLEIPCYVEEAVAVYHQLFGKVAELMEEEVRKIPGVNTLTASAIEEII